jgi:hypothetical protein
MLFIVTVTTITECHCERSALDAVKAMRDEDLRNAGPIISGSRVYPTA